jgi:competence protein ComEC
MIESGLIHIVVISGLKVSLLARLIQGSLGRWWPKAASLAALAAMAAYALLSGASAAALRAAAMGGVTVAGAWLRRDTYVFVSLAATGAAMLALRPALAQDVSFQLSFVGTLGIAALTDPVSRRLTWIPGLLREPFAATFAAQSVTWPLMVANFHQLSLVAPLANALVLPLLPALLVLGGGGALAASLVPQAGWPLLHLAGLLVGWCQLVIERTSKLPLAFVTLPYFPSGWLAAAAVVNAGGLLVIRLRSFFWQHRVWGALTGAAIVIAALFFSGPDGRVHVTALDVGTGSGVAIRTGSGRQLLIDGGPDKDRLMEALGRALPPTDRTIDAWVLTGGRTAEIGAGPELLRRFKVDRLVVASGQGWTPSLRLLVQSAVAMGVRVDLNSGAIRLDGVALDFSPDRSGILVRTGAASLELLTPQAQDALPGIQAAIFLAGGPSSWEVAPPPISVVEVAAASRTGLPARQFLRGLDGSHILRTDRLGNVQLISGPAGFLLAD